MKLIKIVTVIFATFTVLLTIVFFLWWAMKDKVVFGNEHFDRIKWIQLAATIDRECKRGDMAYDLQQHILAPGVKREEVTALLGRPSLEENNAIEYDLGKCMQVYHGLLINFDADGRLINTRISSH